MRFRWLARVAPLAAALTAGCFATRNDVRLLQADIARLQASLAQQNAEARRDAARRDSARAAEIREIARQWSVTDDSVRSLLSQFGSFRIAVGEGVDAMQEQLIAVLSRQGASAQQIAELRRELDETRMRAAVASQAGDSAAADTAAQVVQPGPASLYRYGFSLLQRGTTRIARSQFEQLLSLYPDSPEAPRALLNIGETYAAEADQGAADSVFALVVERYPASHEAPTALYKRAYALQQANQNQRALQLYNRIVTEYSQSEMVRLARLRISEIGRD